MNRLLQPVSVLALLILSLGVVTPSASAQERSPLLPYLQQGSVRLSLESVEMPAPDDRMGLLGFGYLLDVTPEWYLGLSGYGSVSGDRGGFFTGGFTGGYKHRLIENMWLDTGLFVGGGGGGSAAQGGGLMLRPHAGLSYDFDSFRVGVAASWIDFPNGEIESRHLALTLDIPFSSYRAENPSTVATLSAADFIAKDQQQITASRQEILVKSRRYRLSDSARTTSGEKPDRHLDLLGAEFRQFFTRQGFLLAETMGAFGGKADGYAEVLFGAGYRLPLTRSENLNVIGTVAAGGAGGGEIDTGGGAVLRAEAELGYRFTPSTVTALNGGYIDAVDGSMSGWIMGIKFGTAFETISLGTGGTTLAPDDQLDWARWRVRSSHLSYLEPERLNRHSGQKVHLLGVKIDHFFQDNTYVTGQAAGAYQGKAGGYATGMLGLGWQSQRLGNSDWRLIGELLAGVGGGGSIAVGEGGLVQPSVGADYSLNDSFSLQAMGGQIIALDGDLNSTTIELSLCYRFTTLIRR